MEGEPAAKMKLSVAELSLVTEDEQAPDNLRGALPKINMSVAKMTQEKEGDSTSEAALQLSKKSIKLPSIPGSRVAQLSVAPKECLEEEIIDESDQHSSQIESEQKPETTCQDMSVARLSETQENRDMSVALTELSEPLKDCERTIVELSLAIQSNDWYRRNHQIQTQDSQFINSQTSPPSPTRIQN